MRSLRRVNPTDVNAIVGALGQALEGGDAVCITDRPTELDSVPDDCAVVVATSGSTGTPKRVMLSTQALDASARATESELGAGRWVLALPLSYIAGIMVVVRSLRGGTTPIVYDHSAFDPTVFAGLVNSAPDGPLFTSLVPAQLSRLVDSAQADEEVLRAMQRFTAILVGGGPIPGGLVDRATHVGAQIVRTYGSAETAGGVVYNGIPVGDTELRIDADGILHIRTASLALGYLGDDDRTARDFVDGWFRTSDRAHFDDGRLVIDGRIDDIIITGGVKVSLSAIQKIVDETGISAVVTWVADEQWGQVPVVVSEHDVNLAELREAVAGSLGKAARPVRAITVSHVPLTPSGKVDRVAVRRLVTGDEP